MAFIKSMRSGQCEPSHTGTFDHSGKFNPKSWYITNCPNLQSYKSLVIFFEMKTPWKLVARNLHRNECCPTNRSGKQCRSSLVDLARFAPLLKDNGVPLPVEASDEVTSLLSMVISSGTGDRHPDGELQKFSY